MSEMKVSELIGAELDYWVAKAGGVIGDTSFSDYMPTHEAGWKYSTEWEQGGPLIHKYKINLIHELNGTRCQAQLSNHSGLIVGETPLIAAMRCIVAAKFGDNVDD